MANEDFKQIKVDRHRVGIIGLNAVMEDLAKDYTEYERRKTWRLRYWVLAVPDAIRPRKM